MLPQIFRRPRKLDRGDHSDAGADGDDAFRAFALHRVVGRIPPADQPIEHTHVRPVLGAWSRFALFRSPPLPLLVWLGLRRLRQRRPRLGVQNRALAKALLSQNLDPFVIHACVDGVQRPSMQIVLVRHRLQICRLGGGDQYIGQVPLVLVHHAMGAVVVPRTTVSNHSALGRHVSWKPELDLHGKKTLLILRSHLLSQFFLLAQRRQRFSAAQKRLKTSIKHDPLRLEALALLKKFCRVGYHIFPGVLAQPHPHRADAHRPLAVCCTLLALSKHMQHHLRDGALLGNPASVAGDLAID